MCPLYRVSIKRGFTIVLVMLSYSQGMRNDFKAALDRLDQEELDLYAKHQVSNIINIAFYHLTSFLLSLLPLPLLSPSLPPSFFLPPSFPPPSLPLSRVVMTPLLEKLLMLQSVTMAIQWRILQQCVVKLVKVMKTKIRRLYKQY